ncbi:MAG: GIY-YIG nuclease family protein [Bacteroidetes bacterium]|nr:GIY-YIG nuclease family protein [Bacteroidota bacterium]
MAFTYILFSDSLNKFYIGSTVDSIEVRLRKHLSNHKGFSAKAKDWRVVYLEHADNKAAAAKREREIKKWKSRKMIEKLIG